MKAKQIHDENEVDALVEELTKIVQNSRTEDAPCYKKIHEDYPDLPLAYAIKWDRFDHLRKEGSETIAGIMKVAAALERAAHKCQELLAREEPLTPRYYKGFHNIMAEASHKTEDLLMDLRMKLPLPRPKDDPTQESLFVQTERSPRLLLNAPDSILIWMPHLLKYHQTNNELVFTELKHLLSQNDIQPIAQWHCDLIHVFDESQSLLGMLDADNYPFKATFDILARALRTDDGAYNFSYGSYNMTSSKIKPGTYLHVTKRTQKVRFFQDFEALAQTHSKH